ncbi:hypothetical protein GCM10009422_28450 [Brevundimonas kwangchunensis]|uniref:Uncharacterized protein n=1 Tax=Brevundimonas kwangchunensis TaxID=322163 RepID=A0ABN1H574_9CAUL
MFGPRILTVAAAFVLIAMPAPAKPTTQIIQRTQIVAADGCLSRNGCFFTNTDAGGYWTCPDPQIFVVCLVPQG